MKTYTLNFDDEYSSDPIGNYSSYEEAEKAAKKFIDEDHESSKWQKCGENCWAKYDDIDGGWMEIVENNIK